MEPLIDALKDKDADSRVCSHVARVLGEIGSPAAEPLIVALKDRDWNVRMYAAGALGEIGDARAVEPLIAALKDSDWNVREAAAGALGAIGDQRAVEPLKNSLKDGDWEARLRAARVLGQIGDLQAVELLIVALKDRDWDVRKYAVGALGVIGNPQAVEPLIAALKNKGKGVHEASYVRQAAARALGKIGDVRAVKPLTTVLKGRDWDVREAAAWALEQIGVQPDERWAEVDEKKLRICAKCGRTEKSILQDFEEAERRGIAVIRIGDVLHYCVNCEKAFCGRCQVDLTNAVGCPVCGDRLQPVRKIMDYQRKRPCSAA